MVEILNDNSEKKFERYQVLPAALINGHVNSSKLRPRSTEEVNKHIRDGRIPDQAGTFEAPDGTLAAYDYSYLLRTQNSNFLVPSPKKSVDEIDRTISLPEAKENGKIELSNDWQEFLDRIIDTEDSDIEAVIVLSDENGNYIKPCFEVIPSSALTPKREFYQVTGNVALRFIWSNRIEVIGYLDNGIVELKS